MADQSLFLYILISLLCIMGLGVFLHNTHRYSSKSKAQSFFECSIICSIVYSAMDVVYALHIAGVIADCPVILYAAEILYSASRLVGGFAWFLCSELMQESRLVKTTARRMIYHALMAVMMTLILTTPIHHLLFYFDGNAYCRGPFNGAFSLVVIGLILASGIKALIRSFEKRYFLKKRIYRTLFNYSFIVLIFMLIQNFFGSIAPFSPISALIVVFVVQDKGLKSRIHLDTLTGINNRNAIKDYFHNTFERADESSYLMILDLDDFKGVNDRYGHSTGDTVLKLMATAMKKSVPRSFFIARYGGDEFLIAGRTSTPGNAAEIEKIIAAVQENLDTLVREAQVPFRPTFSAGYKNRTPDIENIPDFFDAADAMMYKRKSEKKAAKSAANT